MNPTITRNCRTSNAARRLIGKYRAQIAVPPQYPELADVFAITFLPGRSVSHFGGGLLRRIGSTLMVVLSYEEPRSTKPDRFTMPLRGFRARSTGTVPCDTAAKQVARSTSTGVCHRGQTPRARPLAPHAVQAWSSRC